jgi:hypothetical protein
MTSSIQCPKCGIPVNAGSKFCSSCGTPLTGGRIQAEGKNNSPGETLRQASDVLNKVNSTVSKVESTINTASKIGSLAGQASGIIIRPPAEWKVVVGEVLPTVGQKMVESAVITAEQHVQQQVQQKVQDEVVRQVSQVLSQPKKDAAGQHADKPAVFSKKEPATVQPLLPVCPSCGKSLAPGKKFCGSCGAPVGARLKGSTTPVCPSCGRAIVPGKKFCGSCGATLGNVTSVSQPSACPSCGKPLTPGKKFCSSCGHKLG